MSISRPKESTKYLVNLMIRPTPKLISIKFQNIMEERTLKRDKHYVQKIKIVRITLYLSLAMIDNEVPPHISQNGHH